MVLFFFSVHVFHYSNYYVCEHYILTKWYVNDPEKKNEPMFLLPPNNVNKQLTLELHCDIDMSVIPKPHNYKDPEIF